MTARNPYLFVVGVARSGTTLLQRMLDNHPLLAVSNDPAFTHRPLIGLPPGTDPLLTSELVGATLSLRTFGRLRLPEDAARRAAETSRTWSEFVSAVYDALARNRGKEFAGEKMARYVTRLPQLAALFPWARFVHIIRDGRDVALSNLDWANEERGPGRLQLWTEEPVAVSALSWSWMVSTGRRDGLALGVSRYHEVHYEELLDRSEAEAALRRVASFLDLPYAREMLTYYEGKIRSKPGLNAKQAWLPPTRGLRDWRTQMSPRDLELYEALAGDVLAAVGYERAVDSNSPEITKVAERCRCWWDSERVGPRLKREEYIDAGAATSSQGLRPVAPDPPCRVESSAPFTPT